MRSRTEIKQAPSQSQVSQLQLVDSPTYLPASGSAAVGLAGEVSESH